MMEGRRGRYWSMRLDDLEEFVNDMINAIGELP
jgi:hypothetical protein